MNTVRSWVHTFAGVGLVAVLIAPPAAAQDGTNVLVVLNVRSPESKELATRYAEARRVPPGQVIWISTTTDDEIERRGYDLEIEIPIAEWLSKNAAQDRIHYIVLIKGVPLRIRGTGGLNGTVASVDSELTLLYRKLL